MAAAVGRLCRSGLLQPRNGCYSVQVNNYTTLNWTRGRKYLSTAFWVLSGSTAAVFVGLDITVRASEDRLHPPKLPWSHKGFFKSFDHASIRRGYEVYKQVCAACHSMKFMAYRKLVNVSHTEEEAKKEAEEIDVKDGPNESGEYYLRPGKLSDHFPSPYPNEEAARFANNGAYPPDLSVITLGRHNGADYVFHLLTGYADLPAGVAAREGMYYNPYFPGGFISMAKALYDEAVEYSDGTPATTSQLAKDVSTFLKWAAEPEYDIRAKMLLKVFMWFPLMIGVIWYYKRFVWSTVKSRKIIYTPPSPKYK